MCYHPSGTLHPLHAFLHFPFNGFLEFSGNVRNLKRSIQRGRAPSMQNFLSHFNWVWLWISNHTVASTENKLYDSAWPGWRWWRGQGSQKNPFRMSFLLQATRPRTWKHNSAKTFPAAFQRWSKKPLWTFTAAKRKQPSGPTEEWINKRGRVLRRKILSHATTWIDLRTLSQ